MKKLLKVAVIAALLLGGTFGASVSFAHHSHCSSPRCIH